MKRSSVTASLALAGALMAAPAMAADFEVCATTTDGQAARITIIADGTQEAVQQVWDATASALSAEQLAGEEGFHNFIMNVVNNPHAAITGIDGTPVIGGPACAP